MSNPFLPDSQLTRRLREAFVVAGLWAQSPGEAAVVRRAFLYELVRELYDEAKFGPGFGRSEIESIGKVSDAVLDHQIRMLDIAGPMCGD